MPCESRRALLTLLRRSLLALVPSAGREFSAVSFVGLEKAAAPSCSRMPKSTAATAVCTQMALRSRLVARSLSASSWRELAASSWALGNWRQPGPTNGYPEHRVVVNLLGPEPRLAPPSHRGGSEQVFGIRFRARRVKGRGPVLEGTHKGRGKFCTNRYATWAGEEFFHHHGTQVGRSAETEDQI